MMLGIVRVDHHELMGEVTDPMNLQPTPASISYFIENFLQIDNRPPDRDNALIDEIEEVVSREPF